MSRAVLRVDKLTWQPVERFESAGAAAAAVGMTRRRVQQMAAGNRLPRERYAYRFEDAFDPDERLARRVNEPVDVTDERAGRRYRVASVSALAEMLGVPHSTAGDALRRGGLLMGRFRVGRTE